MLKRAFTLLAAATALLVPATAAFAAIPQNPRWESSARAGTWNHGGFLFQNDMWNCPQAACGKQTIWADSARNWGAVSAMATGNTAVLTYPDIGKLFNDEPVSHFSLIRNGFTETMPRQIKGLSAEAADDVWLNNYNIEMMIWVDSVGRSLAGATRIGSATISGQHFSVWKYGSTEFIFKLNHNETSGQTAILASINWLISHGHVPASVTLTQVDFGWEIASTHWSSAASRPGITGCTPEHVEPARASAAMPPAAPSPPRTPAPRVMPEGAVRRGSRPARHHHPGPAAPALAGGVRTRRQ